jgi:hypothetical protein
VTCFRPVIILTVAISIAAAARDAGAGGADRHLGMGVLLPKGIRSFSARPTLSGDLTKVWSPADRLELGLEAGLAATSLPYGRSDGPGLITDLDNRHDSLTLLPRVMFGPRIVAASNVCLGMSLGATWLWSASTDLAIVPYPTASASIETWFGPDGRFGLRASFSYMHYWFANGNDAMRNALLAPSLAFSWAN